MIETTDKPASSPDGPRISGLHLGNFKAFGPTQRVPLRPLTIVFGPNSSGKSSIIHGLVFAHEGFTNKKPNNLDVHQPKIGGESIDLGGFRQFVFRRDPTNRVEWGCELDISQLPPGVAGMLCGATTVTATVTIQWHRYTTPAVPTITVTQLAEKLNVPLSEVLKECATLKTHLGSVDEQTELEGLFQAVVEVRIRKAQLERSNNPDEVPDTPDIDAYLAYEVIRDNDGLALQGPRVSGYTISVDGAPFLKASIKGSRLEWRMKLDLLDTDHALIKNWLNAFVEHHTMSSLPTEEVVALVKELVDELVPAIELEQGRFVPTAVTHEALQSIAQQDTQQRVPRSIEWSKQLRLLFPREVSRVIALIAQAIVDNLTRDVSGLKYLGPLRSYPPRHLAFGEQRNDNWLAGGGFAWDVVRHDVAIRRLVNRWLGAEFMKTPYELTLQLLYDIEDMEDSVDEVIEEARSDERLKCFEELCGNLGHDFQEVVAQEDIDDPVLDIASGFVTEDLERVRKGLWPRQEGTTDFNRLMDTAKRDVEPIRDLWLVDKRTGTKISHRDVGIGVSQVLPVLVTAYASRHSLVAMEQPELHLHPALQAELGDVFIESALTGMNTFILETHSEHLILRILKRIRETTTNRNNHTPAIKPEHVTLLYVNPTPNGAEIMEIPIDPRGRLKITPPGGFFEEDFEEMF